ncbi:Acetoin catabolism regulatory protein [Roseobacter fucihabitans]|uniref:Acetoin catabolism regulatory protein n=1 Tax=Roseobacter fucihabitans TaxID=1537242 RepID=A0ABZ2BPG2_9RHOB|nr:sigma-54-dependent Fis family transcriptional regulator [Roseobacter litoralis]MBC6966701.1 Acetoin catabolism regulatory protein [Roseobacter litoralis]
MSATDHIREIEAALSCAPVARDAFVVESWRRCVEQHGLDPARPSPAYIVPETQLRAHQERAQRLTSIARSGVAELFRQVAGQNYVLMLTDAQGVTVDFFGDANFEEDLRASGLFLGADWSEAQSGTSGVGTCLATGTAVTVHQQDHFDPHHIPLSCSAAPIHDLDGSLAAVLDVSLLRSPQPKSTQALALHMVTSAARRIELANLMAGMRNNWVLRFSARPEFLEVDPEAALGIDDSGRIIAGTHHALALLAGAEGAPVLGCPVGDFFSLEVEDLPAYSRASPSEERRLFLASGRCVYAHAIAPQPATRPRPVPMPPLPAPLAALHAGDSAVAKTLRVAANLAQTDLPIWITGASGTGKERLARAIHKVRDETAPFVVLQCADFPERELDDILFGDGRGQGGLIRAAQYGVLFLDQIDELPRNIQSRLARAIGDDGIRPAHGGAPIAVRAKIISASVVPIAQSGLRPDLLYRLSGAALALPALGERSDFDGLVDRLIRRITLAMPLSYRLSEAAREALRARIWSGNIRELKNTLQVAVAMAQEGIIDLDHLPAPVVAPARTCLPTAQGDLEQMLIRSGWNVSRVARARGVDRSTLHRQMKRAGLRRP